MAKSKKRSSAKERRAVRQQAKKQQRNLQIIIGVVVAIVVVGGALLLSGNSRSVAFDERFELDPILGSVDAPITLIEYGAYGCHACEEWHNAGVVEQILAEYGDSVRFIYRDMPIISPAYSQRAAEVAQCGLDQGNDQFWNLHDAIFHRAQQGVSSQDEIIQLGIEEGLDGDALRECVYNNTHRDTVRYDLQRGQQLGINGTPTWFVNNQRIFNASPDTLRAAINTELSRLNS